MKIKNIELETKQNIRDFSYIINKNNQTVKAYSIIRSNNINNFSRKDLELLKEKYNIKTILDLRNKKEVENNPSIINKIKYYNIPLFEKKRKKKRIDSNNQNISRVPNIYETYMEMIESKEAKKQLKKILKVIMNPKNSNVLFHCTYGKDRTGVISLLILSMLDVDIKDIKEDYLYSNKYMKVISKKKYKEYLEKTRDDEYSKQMREVFLAKEDYLDYIIDYMNKRQGSILNYIIKEIGIKEKAINKFKDYYLNKIDK